MFDNSQNEVSGRTDDKLAGVGIRGLQVRPRPVEPPAPGATAGDEAGKEGKGGKGGEPSFPPSNAEFLRVVVSDVPEGASAAVCSKAGDPTAGEWVATAAGDVDAQCPDGSNNYLNCSSFVADGAGAVRARKDQFAAFHVIVLDDVGTKVDRSKLAGFKSTWEIETSPGNSQVGIRLTTPLTDPAVVDRLQSAAVAAGLSDPGAKGLARWVRFPNAINGKAKYQDGDGQPFQCQLMVWNPAVSYTVDELAAALGLQLNVAAPPTKRRERHVVGVAADRGDDVYQPTPAEHPVVTALRDRGLYKRPIGPGKHDVTCPWVTEHTDAQDSGAAYFEPDEAHPVGGYKCQHSHGDRYRIGELLKFLDMKADRARGKARIDIVPGEMNRVRKAAEQTLAARGGYYQAGGAIVVIRTDPGNGDISTELLGEAALTSALSDAADWYRYDGRAKEPVRTDPPPRNVQALLRAQEFVHLPPLTGLARQPFFRERDGVLVGKPGYDTTSGRYAAFDAIAFVLPEPTEAAARAALDDLGALLDEFRFAAPEDRAAALSAMLTAAVRPSLPTAPAFNITASTPGSGKSYLASTIVPFAGPGAALKISYPTTADEASKAMLSTFLSAPAAVVFDDMQSQWMPFGAINRALTSDTITDRVLGVSRTVTVGTRSLILGTGNNVGPVRDMTRRVVTIKLHHRTATPALQHYNRRPAEAVLADRGRYVAAALTIIAAYRRAGSPKAEVPSIASYEAWSDMCRQPLLWLGQPDPAASIIAQVRHDPDQDDLGLLLKAWHGAVGDRPVTLRELIDASVSSDALQEALEELPVNDREVVNRSKFGWYLKRNVDRVVGGFELQKVALTERNGWRVVIVNVEPGHA